MKNLKEYPKVLLLCNFNQRTANGITIKNLFKLWPIDSIAVADYQSTIKDIYSDGISKYYIIGNKESNYIMPFNFIKKTLPSKSYSLTKSPTDENSLKSSSIVANKYYYRLKSIIYNLQMYLLHLSGLSLITKKYSISDDFNKWINEFNPDIIYTSISDIGLMEFIIALKTKYKKKLVVHIFDDFINSAHESTLFKNCWKKKLDMVFRKLLEASDLNLTISEKMSNEYNKKYNKCFYAFHNPISEEIWLNPETFEKTTNRENNSFKFVFTGSIIPHTAPALKLFIQSLDKLNSSGYKLDLDIYTPSSTKVVRALLGNEAEKCYKGFVKNDKIPEKIMHADSLLLALAFNKKSIIYTRLSMATKVTEYMISHKPIFVFAPGEIAVSEYLDRNNSAYIASDPSRLLDDIKLFISDSKLREKIAENAFFIAKSFHLGENVRSKFCKQLMNISMTNGIEEDSFS